MTSGFLHCGRAGRNLDAAGQMIAYVRGLIERGALRPGDRLGSERELVQKVGRSRASVREGLRALAAMGLVWSRQGSGTYITAGPPSLASEPLGLLTALHGISRGRLSEARRVLETSTAALAAERATGEQLAAIADAVTGMYAALDDPNAFLEHEALFHRVVAAAADNLVLGAFVGMMASLHHEQLRRTQEQSKGALRQVAEMHGRTYRAIRDHDVEGARAAMGEQLRARSGAHSDSRSGG